MRSKRDIPCRLERLKWEMVGAEYFCITLKKAYSFVALGLLALKREEPKWKTTTRMTGFIISRFTSQSKGFWVWAFEGFTNHECISHRTRGWVRLIDPFLHNRWFNEKKISGAGVLMLTSINLALMCITTFGIFFWENYESWWVFGIGLIVNVTSLSARK